MGSGNSMKQWGRWSKLAFLGALLAELFLPSPSAIGARLSARLSPGLTPYQALSAAIAGGRAGGSPLGWTDTGSRWRRQERSTGADTRA
jgi:hypothetical protein